MVGLALAAAAYGGGASRWRGRRRRAVVAAWRVWCWYGGLATLALALLSPLARLDDDLLSVHMVQHVLLLLVAPPLLWLGSPLVPVLWAFPARQRRTLGGLFHESNPVHRVFHFLTDARVAGSLFLVVVGLWHVPALYNLAQGPTFMHGLEHTLFLAVALLYWWPIVHPSGGRRRLAYGQAIGYLFVASVEGFLIGALLALADTVVYAHYAQVPGTLSPLSDQHLGGLVMLIPTGVLWMAAVITVLVRWMGSRPGLSDEMFLYLSSLGRR